jgi:hypothetical protein
VFRDEENNEMEQGKRWDDGWDGELIDGEDDEMEQSKRWGDGLDGELIDGENDEMEQSKRWGDGLDGELKVPKREIFDGVFLHKSGLTRP